MRHKQNIKFSAFVCVLVLAIPSPFSANVGKIEPIFSGEQEDFDADRWLESGKTDLKDFLTKIKKVGIDTVASEQETKEVFSAMGLDRDSVKSGGLDSTDDDSGDDQSDSDNEMPGDLFPGEVFPEMQPQETKAPAQPEDEMPLRTDTH